MLVLSGGSEARGGEPLIGILSPRGELAGAADARAITLWDRRSGEPRARVPLSNPFWGALTPGGLVARVDGGLRVFSGALFQHEIRVQLPPGVVPGRAAISQDGRVVAAAFPRKGGAGDPDSVGLWNGRTGALRLKITLDRGRVLGLALAARGQLLAVFGDDPQQGALLRVYRVKGRSARPIIRTSDRGDRTTYGAVFDRRARRLVLSSGGRLLVWDLTSRKIVARAETEALIRLFPPRLRRAGFSMPPAHLLALSADGRRLATLHAFGVVGVGLWQVPGRGGRGEGLRPLRWIRRPDGGGRLGPLAWDRGKLWLLTAEKTRVVVHTPHGDRFRPVRTLSPPRK